MSVVEHQSHASLYTWFQDMPWNDYDSGFRLWLLSLFLTGFRWKYLLSMGFHDSRVGYYRDTL